MTQSGQTSPAVVSRGTQEQKRIVLTRRDFARILLQYDQEVKGAHAISEFIDRVFNEPRLAEVIAFDSQAKPGERLT